MDLSSSVRGTGGTSFPAVTVTSGGYDSYLLLQSVYLCRQK